MSSASLYNKYRSRTFADPDDAPLIGQDHITRTLRNAVATNQVGHAYLFCGPRGTGKTSAARILARAVNCRRGLRGEPCNQCENCQALLSGRQLDLLIEIDGASNRGVEDARGLRERLLQRPGGGDLTGRFKVYIIDEVHMLTTEAFNALLKSLEEPPPYVIFVLATTDPQKVPATVASRCQRFDFKPIPLELLAKHLYDVAVAEHVDVEPAALELLARTAAGGARDAVSLLDQALAYAGAEGAADGSGAARGRITAAQVQAMLGLTDTEAVLRLMDALIARDLPAALRHVQEVVSSGSDLRQFTRQVLEMLRAMLLTQSQAANLLHLTEEQQMDVAQRAERLQLADVIRLIKLFGQAEQGLKSPAVQPQLPLELAVVEALVGQAQPAAPAQVVAPTQIAAPAAPPLQPATPAAAPAQPAAPASAPAARMEAASPPGRIAAAATEAPTEDDAPWPDADSAPAPERAREAPASAPPGASSPAWTLPDPPHGAAPHEPVPAVATGQTVTLDRVLAGWPSVLGAVRQHSKNLEALLRDEKLVKVATVAEGNTVVLEFRHGIHQRKLQDIANAMIVQKALTRALGTSVTVRCVLTQAAEAPAGRAPVMNGLNDPVVSTAIKMFNGRALAPEEAASISALPEVPLSTLLGEKE